MAIIIALLCISGSRAYIQEDLKFITDINPVYTAPVRVREESGFSFRQTSEIKLAFTGLIRLYQIFVSPQGPPSCNFTVTCSQFLSRAVRKFGFIHGVLMGADRLTRCTYSTRKFYTIDPKTGRAIDLPVDAYYLNTKCRLKPDVSTGGQ